MMIGRSPGYPSFFLPFQRTRPYMNGMPTNDPQLPDSKPNSIAWQMIAASEDFKELIRAKRRFILPATIFFVLYYFALPYLVGYHPKLMQRKVWGEVNLAYLFALSQFFMAWTLAALYVVVAKGWDRKATALIAKFRQ